MTAPARLVSARELLELPDDSLRRELVAGRVISEPPASFRHGETAAHIFRRLADFVAANDLGIVVSTETGFVLARDPDTVRAPDVAFVSRERLTRVGAVAGFFPEPPDLAVEVVSPTDQASDVTAKVGDYLTAGTSTVWVVEPDARRLTVHRPSLAPRILVEAEIVDGEEVLPGFRARVAELL